MRRGEAGGEPSEWRARPEPFHNGGCTVHLMHVRRRGADPALVVELVDRDRSPRTVGVDDLAVEVGALLRLQPTWAGDALHGRLGARDLPRQPFGFLLIDA